MFKKFIAATFCKIGIHFWDQYYDKLREGDFYCKYCYKDMNDNDLY
jgi:hypothetical protein